MDPYTSWATLERPSFVGRAALLARLGECTSRLVTVYGPPGAGKTRLVVHHLSDPARGFARGAPFVVCEVAGAASVDELSAIVRADLGSRAETAPAGGALGDLGEELATKGPLVVVLDGLDRASDVAAPAVAAWLARAPDLRIIVTSRRRLGLPSEACFEVSALPEADAVQLFEARTRLLKPDFSVHDANADDVRELVRELDCLPLAIELAAGRAAVLSPRELRARLGQRFQLLRGRGGATSSHLESAIAVSFELLPEALERALAQASAFRGSFGLAAAEAVLTLPDGALAVDALDELCARSLVRSFEPATLPGETRFALYESIRAFAEAAFPDEARAAAERHATFFAGLADELSARLKETRGGEVMDELAIEEPNLVAAFERSLTSAPDRAIRAVLALRPLVDAAGPVGTYIERLARARAAAATDGQRARVDLALGRARVLSGDLDRAKDDLERSRVGAEQAGLEDVASEARSILALALYWQGRPDDAVRLYAEAAGDDGGEQAPGARPGDALFATGVMHLLGGRAQAARPLLEQAVAERRREGDLAALGLALAVFGNVNVELQNHGEARVHFDEAESVLGRAKSARFLAMLHLWRAFLLLDEGRLPEAEQMLLRAKAGLEKTQDRFFLRSAVGYLGITRHLAGDPDGALACFEEAIAGATDSGHHYPLGHFLVHKGAVLAKRGETSVAEDTFDAAQRLAQASLRPQLAVTAEVLRSLVDVARAKRAESPDDRAAHTANAELRIKRGTGLRGLAPDRASELSLDIRLALRLAEPEITELKRELGGAAARATLRVGARGMWFQVGDGPRVDLARRALLRRLLECLAGSDSGACVDSFALLDAGWPGEIVSAESGLHRVHVAVATLRKMGLGPVLVTEPQGYRIDAAVVRSPV